MKTVYEAIDGTLHDSTEAAEQHERALRSKWMKESPVGRLLAEVAEQLSDHEDEYYCSEQDMADTVITAVFEYDQDNKPKAMEVEYDDDPNYECIIRSETD